MTISLHELERSPQKSIWVKNNTPKVMRDVAPGTLYSVAINYANEYGEKDRVSVPATFIPYELTQHASKKQFLQSTSFRNQVIKGNLVLLSEEEAEKECEKLGEAYQKEYRRITSAKHIDIEQKEEVSSEDESWVRNLLKMDGETPAYDEAQVMQVLRMNELDISQDKWKYIVQFAKDDSVKEFALSKVQ